MKKTKRMIAVLFTLLSVLQIAAVSLSVSAATALDAAGLFGVLDGDRNVAATFDGMLVTDGKEIFLFTYNVPEDDGYSYTFYMPTVDSGIKLKQVKKTSEAPIAVFSPDTDQTLPAVPIAPNADSATGEAIIVYTDASGAMDYQTINITENGDGMMSLSDVPDAASTGAAVLNKDGTAYLGMFVSTNSGARAITGTMLYQFFRASSDSSASSETTSTPESSVNDPAPGISSGSPEKKNTAVILLAVLLGGVIFGPMLILLAVLIQRSKKRAEDLVADKNGKKKWTPYSNDSSRE